MVWQPIRFSCLVHLQTTMKLFQNLLWNTKETKEPLAYGFYQLKEACNTVVGELFGDIQRWVGPRWHFKLLKIMELPMFRVDSLRSSEEVHSTLLSIVFTFEPIALQTSYRQAHLNIQHDRVRCMLFINDILPVDKTIATIQVWTEGGYLQVQMFYVKQV